MTSTRSSDQTSDLPVTPFLNELAVRDLADLVVSKLAFKTRLVTDASAEVRRLCAALLDRSGSAGHLARIIEQMPAQTMPETEYLGNLNDVAAELGDRFDRGLIRASDVRLASHRLECALRKIASLPDSATARIGRRAVFATVPGETHTVGIHIAAERMRRDGWQIELRVGRTHAELLRELATSDIGILGLSAGSVESENGLSDLIEVTREKFPGIRTLASGALMADADALGRCRAHHVASDFATASHALETMQHDLRRQAWSA